MERLVLWHRLIPVPDDPDSERRDRWTRAVVRRVTDARGVLLCTVGSTVAACFDVVDLERVLDLALDLLGSAEREEPHIPACIALAAGELRESAREPAFPFPSGTVLDRAQLLANRARLGELVLDREARSLANRVYLFGRAVATGVAGLRGEALDRDHPRRDGCRRAIRHLQPAPVPPCTADATRDVVEALDARGRHAVLLRGPRGAGVREWLDALERTREPALVLRIEAVPGGLEPLGGLRLALLRRWGSPDGVAAAMTAAALDPADATTLTRVAEGRAVARDPALLALRALLSTFGDDDAEVWIVLDPLSGIDAATVDAVATAASGTDVIVFTRLGVDEEAPPFFSADARTHEVLLPALRGSDARAVARGVLGEATDDDVVRRVGVLGGDTPLGVVEAARTLVAAGDLVHDGDKLVWRVSPRGGIEAIAAESLIEERLATVEPTLIRVLGAACVAPSGASTALIAEVCKADGLDAHSLADAVARLREEALLRPDDPWQPTSSVLREVVLQSMHPARLNELNRFVAEAVERTSHRDGELTKATVGWYLAEGGRERDGARALIEAGRAAQLAGFTRAALRLAAAAVQYDDSDATRAAATTLTRAARRPLPPPPGETRRTAPAPITVVAPPDDDGTEVLSERVVHGILTRDFEAADRYIDIAVAEGCDRGAAERLRALGLLARGDLAAAMRALASSRELAADDRAEARGALAHALVLLYASDLGGAVRAALASLAKSRARRDPRGEAAALHALALCYRALGKEQEAEAIEEASPA